MRVCDSFWCDPTGGKYLRINWVPRTHKRRTFIDSITNIWFRFTRLTWATLETGFPELNSKYETAIPKCKTQTVNKHIWWSNKAIILGAKNKKLPVWKSHTTRKGFTFSTRCDTHNTVGLIAWHLSRMRNKIFSGCDSLKSHRCFDWPACTGQRSICIPVSSLDTCLWLGEGLRHSTHSMNSDKNSAKARGCDWFFPISTLFPSLNCGRSSRRSLIKYLKILFTQLSRRRTKLALPAENDVMFR